MLLPESEAFLRDVLARVHFFYDKDKIRAELENHLSDKTEDLVRAGLDENAAEKQAVAEMGDAREIGAALNRIHNPFLGFLWLITNIAAFFSILICLLLLAEIFIGGLIFGNPARNIPKASVAEHITIHKTVCLDDVILRFTDVYRLKNGGLTILYRYHDRYFRPYGWSLGSIGRISDNLGNSYIETGGTQNSGLIDTGESIIEKFNPSAGSVIISYDNYNRHYRVVIPLKAGDNR